jgi:hypothetical protein
VRAARRREVGGNDALHIRNSVADTCPFHCFTPRSPQFPIQVIARATRPRSTKGGSVPNTQLERSTLVRLSNILLLNLHALRAPIPGTARILLPNPNSRPRLPGGTKSTIFPLKVFVSTH